MKHCPKCDKDYSDEMGFCPECGTKLTTPNKMHCPNCNKDYPENMKFCPECGHPLVQQNAPKFCTQCGSPLAPGSKFCTNCGASVQAGGCSSGVSAQGNPATSKDQGYNGNNGNVASIVRNDVSGELVINCGRYQTQSACYTFTAEEWEPIKRKLIEEGVELLDKDELLDLWCDVFTDDYMGELNDEWHGEGGEEYVDSGMVFDCEGTITISVGSTVVFEGGLSELSEECDVANSYFEDSLNKVMKQKGAMVLVVDRQSPAELTCYEGPIQGFDMSKLKMVIVEDNIDEDNCIITSATYCGEDLMECDTMGTEWHTIKIFDYTDNPIITPDFD